MKTEELKQFIRASTSDDISMRMKKVLFALIDRVEDLEKPRPQIIGPISHGKVTPIGSVQCGRNHRLTDTQTGDA
jgi:hypothetical protein